MSLTNQEIIKKRGRPRKYELEDKTTKYNRYKEYQQQYIKTYFQANKEQYYIRKQIYLSKQKQNNNE